MVLDRRNRLFQSLQLCFEKATGLPVAFIVGAGDVGLGIAQMLLEHTPCFVILSNRTEEKVEAAKQALITKGGAADRIGTLVFNGSDIKDAVWANNWLTDKGHWIDLLVLSAGRVIFDDEPDSAAACKTHNYESKRECFNWLRERTLAAVVVSSKVLDFDEHDSAISAQKSYRAAMIALEYYCSLHVANLSKRGYKLAENIIVWRCPLVAGSTASAFMTRNIVSSEQKVPTAYEAALETLWPHLQEIVDRDNLFAV